MKAYFIRLFGYDRFANLLMTETMHKASNPEEALKILCHLLAVQQIWLNRCRGVLTPVAQWPEWAKEECMKLIENNYAEIMRFLEKTEVADFEKLLTYKNLKGDTYQSSLQDILTQIINHGTHHRAQIGQILKQAGVSPLPITDYIAFLRK